MREILFRGMRIASGEWVEGYLFDDGIVNSKSVFIGNLAITKYKGSADDEFEVGLDICEVIPKTVGQYTGLTDKNGAKIFEGDIIDVTTNHHYVGVAVERLGKFTVVFDDGCFMRAKVGGIGKFHFIPTDEIQIIGNIHDNPELMEGGEG